MSLDARTLQRAMTGLSADKAETYAPLLREAMLEGNVTTVRRARAFLAQLGHESLSLRFMEEIASGAKYEGRLDLGNTQPGDGVRYKGRGPIQLTGRANYRRAGQALGLPLEDQPTLAAKPEVGFRTAVWFWVTHGLNELADKNQFRTITLRINGGLRGLKDRVERWRAIGQLGDAILPRQTKEQIWTERLGAERRRLRRILALRARLRDERKEQTKHFAWTTRAMRAAKLRIEKLRRLLRREPEP